MRWFFRFFMLLLILLPIGVLGLALLCIEPDPLVGGQMLMSTGNVERAKVLLREHDPRKLLAGEVKTVSINTEELSLVLNHAINRFGRGGARVELKEGGLTLVATFNLAKFVPGYYLNIDSVITSSGRGTHLEQLKFGQLSLPRAAVRTLVSFGIEHLYRASRVNNASEVIRSIDIHPQQIDITYAWQAGIVEAVRDRLVSREDREKLRLYNRFLAEEIDRQGSKVSFVTLIQSTFAQARQRSVDGDAMAHNRAAIMVFGAYVNGRSLTTLAPEATDWIKPRRIRLKIHGRHDFVQHFATSAVLAVAGGSIVANAIGLSKEIDDADGGSGFSFKDLAADMAGTRFGQIAVESARSARTLQELIGKGLDEASLIPSVAGLEENLNDADFKRRYGGVGGTKYDSVVADIERRISASLLY